MSTIAPQIADRFEIQGELGRGAQGKTYRVIDRTTGETVAIKELLVENLDDWKSLELFEREGRALENLDHPGIPAYVETLHLREGDDERFFLVQEFVDGSDLKSLIQGGRTWSEDEARELMAELLQILCYLHGRNPPVIHRDIKPSNIMLRDDGRLALIDFGAVQTVVPDQHGGSTIVGTSGYMPVEQLMGRARPATDLYALGATVVHLLTHRHPAQLPLRNMRLGFEEFVDLSPGFSSLLADLLHPDPDQRIASAGQALQRLKTAQPPVQRSSRPAQPRPETGPARPSFWQRFGDLDGSQIAMILGMVLAPLPMVFIVAVFALSVYFELTEPTPEDLCLDQDQGPSCLAWAEQVTQSQSLDETTLAELERAYRAGCELEEQKACLQWSRVLNQQGDKEGANAVLEQSCQGGDLSACNDWVILLMPGEMDRAMEAAGRSCDGGSPEGCANLAGLLVSDDDLGIAELRRARRASESSCQHEVVMGCVYLAVVELLLEEPREAYRAALRARQLDKTSPQAHEMLGMATLIDGDIEAAAAHFDDAMELARHNPVGASPPWVLSILVDQENRQEHLNNFAQIYPDMPRTW